jgi:hypothetical protein
MKNGYAVVWTGSGPRETYTIESMHRTLDAAEREADAILRSIRRVPGQQNCGSFHRVFRVEDGCIMEAASRIGYVY